MDYHVELADQPPASSPIDRRRYHFTSVEIAFGVIIQRMSWQDRIVLIPEILAGKPVIKGTRVAVEFVVDLLAQGWSTSQIVENYPGVTPEDIRACLAYASDVLHAEKLYPLKS